MTDTSPEQQRLVRCDTCSTLEPLPAYTGPKNADGTPLEGYDVFLDDYVKRHTSGGQPHFGVMFSVNKDLWDRMDARHAIEADVWKDTKEMGATILTHEEDAMKCFNRHGRPEQGCIDWKDSSKRIGNPTKEGWKRGQVKVYVCDMCLTGDTEVVTSEGLQRIEDLAGKTPSLLVPQVTRWGTGGTMGTWESHEVHYFGEQRVYTIHLTRGKAKKTIRATAEHRWLLDGEEKTTSTLLPGDRLLPLKAPRLDNDTCRVPFAVAQGFVFGDGGHGHNDRRPAHLTICNPAKDNAILPYFASCDRKKVTANGQDGVTQILHLPRQWKRLPSLDDSRSFLVSWLAGYFAADGTVDAGGSASLSSARKEHLEFVRSLAAICGISTNPISTKMREGFGVRSLLFNLNINARDLPDWFWIIEEHKARVQQRLSVKKEQAARVWTVSAVEDHNETESVYCAVVPGVQAFALADDLMTGNCPVKSWVQTQIYAKQGHYKP